MNQGTIERLLEKEKHIEGKVGLERVAAIASALNFQRGWTPAEKENGGWRRINQFLWRVQAMYFGGDTFLAGFPDAKPHQRIYYPGVAGRIQMSTEKSIARNRKKRQRK